MIPPFPARPCSSDGRAPSQKYEGGGFYSQPWSSNFSPLYSLCMVHFILVSNIHYQYIHLFLTLLLRHLIYNKLSSLLIKSFFYSDNVISKKSNELDNLSTSFQEKLTQHQQTLKTITDIKQVQSSLVRSIKRLDHYVDFTWLQLPTTLQFLEFQLYL